MADTVIKADAASAVSPIISAGAIIGVLYLISQKVNFKELWDNFINSLLGRKSKAQLQAEADAQFANNKSSLINWLNSGGSDAVDTASAAGSDVSLGDSGVYVNYSEWDSIKNNPNRAVLEYGGIGDSSINFNSAVNSPILSSGGVTTKRETVFPDFSEAAVLARIKDTWDPENGSAENAAKFLAEKTDVAIKSRQTVANPGISNAGATLFLTNYADGSFETRDNKGQIVASGSAGANTYRTPDAKAASVAAYQAANRAKVAAATPSASAAYNAMQAGNSGSSSSSSSSSLRSSSNSASSSPSSPAASTKSTNYGRGQTDKNHGPNYH